jgi:hypothetical protein
VLAYVASVSALYSDTLQSCAVRPAMGARDQARLAKLIRNSGIALSEHTEGDGAEIFPFACEMRLEGIVSKRRDMPYRAGPSKMWLKDQEPKKPGDAALNDENMKWR